MKRRYTPKLIGIFSLIIIGIAVFSFLDETDTQTQALEYENGIATTDLITIETEELIVQPPFDNPDVVECFSFQCVLNQLDPDSVTALKNCLETDTFQTCVGGQLIFNSIIQSNIVLLESDQTITENFLDSVGFTEIEQLGLETFVILYDKSNNIISEFNTVQDITLDDALTIITLSDEGLADNIQISFNLVSNNPITSLEIQGEVGFFLDDNPIALKKFWKTDPELNVPLRIVDNVPPPFTSRDKIFDFAFIDENFIHDSEHQFTIVITELRGNYQSDGIDKVFLWTGEFEAYKLDFRVDRNQIVKIDEQGNTISVYKSDDNIISCGGGVSKTSTRISKSSYGCRNCSPSFSTISQQDSPNTITPQIIVTDNTGIKIGTIPSFEAGIEGSVTPTNMAECRKIDGISRNSEIIIVVDGQKFPITTPLAQQNYNLMVEYVGNGEEPFVVSCVYTWNGYCAKYTKIANSNFAWIEKITSNFGFGEPIE